MIYGTDLCEILIINDPVAWEEAYPSIWGQRTLFMSTFSIMPPPPPWHTIISQNNLLLFSFNFLTQKATSWDLLSLSTTTKFNPCPDVCFFQCFVLWSKINLFHCCWFLHKCEPFITCITQCQGGERHHRRDNLQTQDWYSSWFKVQGSGFNLQGSIFKVQASNTRLIFKVVGTAF